MFMKPQATFIFSLFSLCRALEPLQVGAVSSGCPILCEPDLIDDVKSLVACLVSIDHSNDDEYTKCELEVNIAVPEGYLNQLCTLEHEATGLQMININLASIPELNPVSEYSHLLTSKVNFILGQRWSFCSYRSTPAIRDAEGLPDAEVNSCNVDTELMNGRAENLYHVSGSSWSTDFDPFANTILHNAPKCIDLLKQGDALINLIYDAQETEDDQAEENMNLSINTSSGFGFLPVLWRVL
eukprot:Blabericola_migrator_1__8038@NODE_4125_length_1320_cov_446_905028_g2552_i0_p1_GENE_NODE_4125_length_1320_cov_446_905028_g2552_i0NODE_4125_length_1320_cov_446_905028_g2552_i0_p1_ORF_typecomplete_len241_score32_12Sec39/PF08314_11/0_0019_NODE_4125_length_1320_cov_446_905028_g2552_i0179901